MATQSYSLEDILRTNYGGTGTSTNSQLVQQYGPNANLRSGADIVSSSLDSILNPNSDYIRNARQSGMEVAATRGGINSSIAAGASQRAAIDAAGTLAQQATQIEQQREQNAMQEYLQGRQINQEFQTQLASSAASNAYNMLNVLQQYALADPETYTPEVISGYSNFFGRTTSDAIKRLLGQA